MSDDDVSIEVLAERLRAAAVETPEHEPFMEDVIARMYRTPAYYTALGKFVTDFSRVETILQTSLLLISGVLSPVAQAIFGGHKIEGCLQLIKRIADAKNWPTDKKAKLEEIINHLGPINKLRNDILHYGTTIDLNAEDAWLLSNKAHVHIPEKIRETSITPALLGDVCSDLDKLWALIILLGVHDLDISISTMMKADEFFSDRIKRSWLYKPPQQAKKSDKSQQTPQKRARPRLSSRAKREAALKKCEK